MAGVAPSFQPVAPLLEHVGDRVVNQVERGDGKEVGSRAPELGDQQTSVD